MRRSWRAPDSSTARNAANHLDYHLHATFLPYTNTNIAPCAFRYSRLLVAVDLQQPQPPGGRPLYNPPILRLSMALDRKECVDAPRRASAEDAHVGDATLLGLPVELQSMILEYIPTNADKKNVCATSKALQDSHDTVALSPHGARCFTTE